MEERRRPGRAPKPTGEKYAQMTFSLPPDLKSSVITKAKVDQVNLSALLSGMLESWVHGSPVLDISPAPSPVPSLNEDAIKSIIQREITEMIERGTIPAREEERPPVKEHKTLDTYQLVSISNETEQEETPSPEPAILPNQEETEPGTISNQEGGIVYPDTVTPEMSIAMGNLFQKFKDKTGIKNRKQISDMFGCNTSNESKWRDGRSVMTRETYGKLAYHLRKYGLEI